MVGYDHDDLVRNAGGRFRFVSLIQRRMRELQHGIPPLVEKRASDIETAIEEFRQGKIWLVLGEDADTYRETRNTELQAAAGRKTIQPPPVSPRPGE